MTFSIEVAKREAKLAVTGCLIIYSFLFLLLLGYRWDTRRYYLSKQRKMIATKRASLDGLLPTASLTKAATTTNQNVVYREPSLAPYQVPIRELTAEVEAATTILIHNLQQLQERTTKLKSIMSDHETLGRKFDALSPSIQDNADNSNDKKTSEEYVLMFDGLISLLSMKQLQQVEDRSTLSVMFQRATSELNSFIGKNVNNYTIDDDDTHASLSVWTHANKVLTDMADRERDPSDGNGTCPPKSTSDSKKKKLSKTKTKKRAAKKLHPDAVSIEDLNAYIRGFDSLFERRTQSAGISAVTPENEPQLIASIDEMIETTIDELITQAQDLIQQLKDQQQELIGDDETSGEVTTVGEDGSVTSVDDCVNPQLIHSLVESGLEAQMVGDDVRDALLRRLGELDRTAAKDDSLILDADLPPPSSKSSSSTSPSSSTINLRDVLDTPILVKSIDWIDQLVDLVGGYNDNLDRYLDSLTDHGAASVGEVIIQRTLEQAGLINVDPQGLADKHLPSGSSEVVSKLLGKTTSTKGKQP